MEAGPIAAGFTTGVWTGPMVGEVIAMRFGVRYHKQHVPRLLHQLGFSGSVRGSGWRAQTPRPKQLGSAIGCLA